MTIDQVKISDFRVLQITRVLCVITFTFPPVTITIVSYHKPFLAGTLEQAVIPTVASKGPMATH